MVQIPRLQAAHEHGHDAHHPSAAVDEAAVDDRLVADLPQQAAEPSARTCQHVLVEPVEVVLVLQHAVQARELRQEPRRDVGPHEVQIKRRGEARRG